MEPDGFPFPLGQLEGLVPEPGRAVGVQDSVGVEVTDREPGVVVPPLEGPTTEGGRRTGGVDLSQRDEEPPQLDGGLRAFADR